MLDQCIQTTDGLPGRRKRTGFVRRPPLILTRRSLPIVCTEVIFGVRQAGFPVRAANDAVRFARLGAGEA